MTGTARTPQVRWVVAATEVHGDDMVDFDCLDGAIQDPHGVAGRLVPEVLLQELGEYIAYRSSSYKCEVTTLTEMGDDRGGRTGLHHCADGGSNV